MGRPLELPDNHEPSFSWHTLTGPALTACESIVERWCPADVELPLTVYRLGIMSGLDEFWDGHQHWDDDEFPADETAPGSGAGQSVPSQAGTKRQDNGGASSCAGSVGAPRR